MLNSAKETGGLIDDDVIPEGWGATDDLDALAAEDEMNKPLGDEDDISGGDDKNEGGWEEDDDDLNLPADFLANSNIQMGTSVEGTHIYT